MKLPNPRRMYERARWLRSDGKPNFKTAIHGREPELRSLVVPNVPLITPQTPLLKCVEDMSRVGFRASLVLKAGALAGLVSFHDIADYLGGGSRHRIVIERYRGNIYKALSIPSQELMNRNVVSVNINDTLTKALELMITLGIGVVPVLEPDGSVSGVITEGSIVKIYSQRIGRRSVSEVMTRNLITAGDSSSLSGILKLMVSTGVRRIPLLDSYGRLSGVLTWRGIIEFVGSHRIFEYSKSGGIEEVLEARAIDLADRDVIVVDPGQLLETLVEEMYEKNLDYGLVAEGEVLKGIVTERDIMYAVIGS